MVDEEPQLTIEQLNLSESADIKINEKFDENNDNNITEIEVDDSDYWQSAEWRERDKHIFVLSSAGKPIYSRYGSEEKLVTMFGFMQALVSVVSDSQDEIQSLHCKNSQFAFLRKDPIILVSVSRIPRESIHEAILQLNYVYNQIISIVTLSHLTRIFEQHNNFDLRRLLSGSERLIDSFLRFTEIEPAFFLGGIECLPLPPSTRDSIVSAVTTSCCKIKNLLFAILVAEKQLVSLVRMKKYDIQPQDLHLIFNLVDSSQSFKTAESWTPICLPSFDPSGFLQAHVSYLAEDCPVCLLLVTVDRESFFVLSEAQKNIVEKLRKSNCFEQINECIGQSKLKTSELDVPSLRHFIYKDKSTNQFIYPMYEVPYNTPEQQKILLDLYRQLYNHLHTPSRPLKLLFQQLDTEIVLAWDTKSFQLFLILEPFATKSVAIDVVDKLLKIIKKKEDRFLINNSPTF